MFSKRRGTGCSQAVSKAELLAQRDRVFSPHPHTIFVVAYMAERGEDLAYVGRPLDSHANLLVDMNARTAELGRQPYTAREFLVKYADRILFGTDLVPKVGMYRYTTVFSKPPTSILSIHRMLPGKADGISTTLMFRRMFCRRLVAKTHCGC